MAALENRIAPTIWLMLTTIALAGSPDVRWVVVSPLVWVITPLMVAAVPGLIADWDSPRSGFIRTDLRSLEGVEGKLAGPPAKGK